MTVIGVILGFLEVVLTFGMFYYGVWGLTKVVIKGLVRRLSR